MYLYMYLYMFMFMYNHTHIDTPIEYCTAPDVVHSFAPDLAEM